MQNASAAHWLLLVSVLPHSHYWTSLQRYLISRAAAAPPTPTLSFFFVSLPAATDDQSW